MEQTISANTDLLSKKVTYLEKNKNPDLIFKKTSSVRFKTPKKDLELGPLESVFPCSTSKILDFLVTFKDFDYSISDISKNSGVGFKTTLNEIRKLEENGVIKRTRTVGKAIMYRLNLDSSQARSIKNLAFEIASKRAQELAAQ